MRRPPFPASLRPNPRALLACTLVAAAAVAGGCANPRELVTGAIGRPPAVASWQTLAAPTAEAARPLSEGEGELVVASAIAAHEMRRP
jgi:hypothetical protein